MRRARCSCWLSSATSNYIANHVRTLVRDTVLAGGVGAAAGTQITTPRNMSGYWSIRGGAEFGFPFEVISSNLNISTNASVGRSPGKLNETEYASTNWSFGGGLSIGTNVSREIDGHLSYNATYTTSRNTLTPNVPDLVSDAQWRCSGPRSPSGRSWYCATKHRTRCVRG